MVIAILTLSVLVLLAAYFRMASAAGAQPIEPLVSRAALRASLELLWHRGVNGTSFRIEFPGTGSTLSLTKRLADDRTIHLEVTVSTGASASTQAVAGSADGISGDARRDVYGAVQTIEDAIALIDEFAQESGNRLFPGSMARFDGRVLAFNVPSRTGSAE